MGGGEGERRKRRLCARVEAQTAKGCSMLGDGSPMTSIAGLAQYLDTQGLIGRQTGAFQTGAHFGK